MTVGIYSGTVSGNPFTFLGPNSSNQYVSVDQGVIAVVNGANIAGLTLQQTPASNAVADIQASFSAMGWQMPVDYITDALAYLFPPPTPEPPAWGSLITDATGTHWLRTMNSPAWQNPSGVNSAYSSIPQPVLIGWV